MKNMNRANEEEHKGMIKKMDLILFDNTTTVKDKITKITELGAFPKGSCI